MPKSSAEKSRDSRARDVDAYRQRKREYARTPEQREIRRLYMQGWRERNREKHNKSARESHQRNKHKHLERNANWHLFRKFGITLERKREMVAEQGGRCLICTEPFKTQRSMHLDHDHATGRIRGVLCHMCNTKLGWLETFRDSIEHYLVRH